MVVRDKLKALVPVILGLSDLGASIIERGGLPTRGDTADAFQLAVLGLLVYLVPNIPNIPPGRYIPRDEPYQPTGVPKPPGAE